MRDDDDDIFRPPPPPPKSSGDDGGADGQTAAETIKKTQRKRDTGAAGRWERVENEQHPLGKGCNNNNHHHQQQQQQQQDAETDNSNHPFPYRPTPIDTAMLLKSAARSVLDNSAGSGSSPPSASSSTASTPGKNPNNNNNNNRGTPNNSFDIDNDDEKSSLWMMDNNNDNTKTATSQAKQAQSMAASLSSLQTKTLAAMPDKQDKRRFLGCLAAVLAASYDYYDDDVLDEGEHDDIHQAITRAETALFQDTSHSSSPQSPQLQQQQQHVAVDYYDDDYIELDETEHDDGADVQDVQQQADNGDFEEHSSLLQQAVSSGSFEYSDVGVDSAYLINNATATTTTTAASAMRSSPHSKNTRSASLPPPRQSQQQQQQTHQSQTQQQERIIKQQQNKKLLQSQRHANKVRLSRSRHLKRRYDVFTRLLLAASDYLMLEKSQAKAFVPMLAKLLVPAKKKSKEVATTPDGKKKKKPPPPGQSTTAANNKRAGSTASTTTAMTTTATLINDHSDNTRRTSSSTAPAAAPPPGAGQKPPLWRKSSFSPSGTVATATTLTATTTNDSVHPQELFVERIQQENDQDKEDDDEGPFILQHEIAEIEHLQPFLESMTKGGAFRCLVLVLLQHLLTSPEGYDARIRHAFKTLGVIILVQDIMETTITTTNSRASDGTYTNSAAASTSPAPPPDLVELATRRFESLEHWIAAKLIELSREQEKTRQMAVGRRRPSNTAAGKRASSRQTTDNVMMAYPSRDQIVRGIKVGAMGAAAATLFAVTGGLAAPGIATAAAALAGGTAATAAVATVLTSTTAVVSIFGVGGGTLVAYKMNRRVKGLTEFEFRKEHANTQSDRQETKAETPQALEAELFSTICISGWLRDKRDFQRPWGVTPSNPWITDREELLQRFYAVHRPDHVTKCKKILKSWEGEESELWNLLRQKYGRDPDSLFPLDEGPRFGGSLTLEQKEVVDQLFVELGCCSTANATGEKEGSEKERQQAPTPFDRMRAGWKRRGRKSTPEKDDTLNAPRKDRGKVTESRMYLDSLHGPRGVVTTSRDTSAVHASLVAPEGSSVTSSGFESISTSISMPLDAAVDGHPQPAQSQEDESSSSIPKHLTTVWDYQATYGGELYTVRWESDLLTELCDSVTDLAVELVTGGTAQILKHTALSTLFSAIAWPYALVNAANMIDGTWTLAVERSDEAGRELARSLLFSRAGHRPVTLVGFSFGARTIYSCLKELAKYQEKWTEYRERTNSGKNDASTTAWSYTASGTSFADDEGSDDFYKHMREPASIVEDVVLLGLPNHLSLSSWRACRQVVSGRLVNCFSQRDLILSLMFQFKRMRLGLKPVCGTCPVAIPGVENIDVSDLVSGHQDYCMVTGAILKRLRFQQPFRSRPTKVIVPDISPEEEGKLADKFDV